MAAEAKKMKAVQKEAVAKQVQLDEESLQRLKEAEAKTKVRLLPAMLIHITIAAIQQHVIDYCLCPCANCGIEYVHDTISWAMNCRVQPPVFKIACHVGLACLMLHLSIC